MNNQIEQGAENRLQRRSSADSGQQSESSAIGTAIEDFVDCIVDVAGDAASGCGDAVCAVGEGAASLFESVLSSIADV